MPSQTSGKNLPFPLGTDRLADGDDQIRKLAQSVDNMVQAGIVSVPITAVSTPASVTVNFPVAYAVAPMVVACLQFGSTVPVLSVAVASITTTSFQINARRESGSAAINCYWIAVGPVVAVT